jgi:hypothetical protein
MKTQKVLFLVFVLICTFGARAQLTIGSLNPPDASAIIDMKAVNNKGALLPNVTLTGPNDKVTVNNPAEGLLVYNTGNNVNFPIKAYMYWDGVEWRALNAMTTEAAAASLECGMTYLDPEMVIIGDGVHPIPEGTVMKIPYTIGNGGIYNGCVLTSEGGNITATIYPGQLESGSGYLTFHISGTPNSTQTTPKGIKFSLDAFYAANPNFPTPHCDEVSVGVEVKADIKTVAVIDNLKYTDADNAQGYACQLTTPDGRFSVRAYSVSHDWDSRAAAIGSDGRHSVNLQIRNNTNEDVVIVGLYRWEWRGSQSGNGQNALGLQPGKWSGDYATSNDNDADNPEWACWLDGSDNTNLPSALSTTNKNNHARFIYWGNGGVYAGGSPERRVYSWTTNDGSDTKTAYFFTFSSAAQKPGAYTDAANCPGGVCTGTQMFMKIEQINATQSFE